MKPTNAKVPGCNPISSNCVIWQGPDIPCIKLCKGDTVSDTVYKLAEELCNILTQIDVSTYDLACLSLPCPPSNFHTLIQILIDKICALNDCCNQPSGSTASAGCPDNCIVAICPEFQYQDAFGNTITTMTLKDYVIAIGNKVCSIVQQINTINLTLQNHETRITYIEENCCDQTPPALPTLVPTCIGTPPLALGLVDFVQSLEVAFCELRAATGTASELYVAIAKECVGLDGENRLSGPGTMSSIPGWVTLGNYGTVADAINNMWLTICDMRAAIKFIQQNCCPGSCEDFMVSLSANYSTPNLTLYFTGTIPAGYVTCNPLGITVTITDSFSNSISQLINLNALINFPGGTTIDLSTGPLNLLSDYTITTNICVTNPEDSSQCSTSITYIVQNQVVCPEVVAESTATSISYTLTALYAGTYVVKLLPSCGSTSPIYSNTHTILSPSTIGGSFGPLSSSTAYVIKVEETTTSTVCPCIPVSTLPGPCDPPLILSTVITPVIL